MTAGGLLGEGLDEVGRALGVAGFAALWEQQARRPEELIPEDGTRARDAAGSLARRGRAEVDDVGRLIGIHGLTLRPTRHRFVHHGRARHTWCAFDSIGIPAAVGLDADGHTGCPSCRRPLHVHFDRGVPEPGEMVLWLPDPPALDLMAEFCAGADLYCSMEHLRLRIDPAASPGRPVDLATAATLGRDGWADVADAVRSNGDHAA